MRTKEEILEEMKRYYDSKDSFLLEVLIDIRDLLKEYVHPDMRVSKNKYPVSEAKKDK